MAKQQEMAQKIFDMLAELEYDFIKPSKATFFNIEQMNTFEMMITVPLDPIYFKQLLHLVWKSHKYWIKHVIF